MEIALTLLFSAIAFSAVLSVAPCFWSEIKPLNRRGILWMSANRGNYELYEWVRRKEGRV